jgi:hypothetical protein
MKKAVQFARPFSLLLQFVQRLQRIRTQRQPIIRNPKKWNSTRPVADFDAAMLRVVDSLACALANMVRNR